MKVWYLEGFMGPQQSLQRIRINRFPFRVGRQDGLSLVLDSAGMSREHAHILADEANQDQLLLKDLDSTNGSFINSDRINGQQAIRNGDILHFADAEFRLVLEEQITGVNMRLTQQVELELPRELPRGSREFEEMLLDRQVTAVYQPIVSLADESVYAFEMLGRGTHPDISDSPGLLFRIAESMGMEVHLSELMRQIGVQMADKTDAHQRFFTNIHPAEMNDPERLIGCMETFHQEYPALELVLEIHEGAVVDRKALENIRDRMHDANIDIAYDDFGAGQSRLLALAAVPPNYVKLDMSLIKDIDTALPATRKMVQMLISFAKDHEIKVIAEGVNSDGELEFCTRHGVDLVQSYRFGRPEPLS